MSCPKCGLEGRIASFKYVVEGDNSNDEETKLFIEQEIKCANKNCTNYDKVYETLKNPVQIG